MKKKEDKELELRQVPWSSMRFHARWCIRTLEEDIISCHDRTVSCFATALLSTRSASILLLVSSAILNPPTRGRALNLLMELPTGLLVTVCLPHGCTKNADAVEHSNNNPNAAQFFSISSKSEKEWRKMGGGDRR